MKKKLKRCLAHVIVFAVLCSMAEAASVDVKAAEIPTVYPYRYSIRNFLSDYQYVAKGDLNLKNHTVGGVVSGGDLTLGHFGEAMIMPSYGDHIVKTGNLNATKYDGVPQEAVSNTVYYNTMAHNAIPDYLQSNFVKGEFVKVNEAFASLYSESDQLAQGAGGMYHKSGNTLNIDLSKADSYRIPAEALEKNGTTTVNLIGVDSVDEFTDREYSISFTGIHDSSLYLDYVWGSNRGYDYYIHITFNGKKFEQEMKKIRVNNYAGGQFVNSGMKFITNLPDARGTVVANGLSGHLVAPRSELTVTGGGFEGGIIAGSISGDAEGHFYPYYKIGEGRPDDGGIVYPEKIGGKIIISKRECTALKSELEYRYAVKPGTKAYLEALDTKDTISYYIDTNGGSVALTAAELDQKMFTPYDPANPPVLTGDKIVVYEKVTDDKDENRYVYVNSEVFIVKTPNQIVETTVDKPAVYVGEEIQINTILDQDHDHLIVSDENADFQWQYYDETENRWKDIEGENQPEFRPDETLEGKRIQCVVEGKNGYTGTVSDESIVKALPPVVTEFSETTITIEAEEGFEYEIRDKEGRPVVPWVQDGGTGDGDPDSGKITFEGLTPSTEYDLVKRKKDVGETESFPSIQSTIISIIKADLNVETARPGETVTVKQIIDVNQASVPVDKENAAYQWQVKDETGEWKDIAGATDSSFVPDASYDGRDIRCKVTGIWQYVGEAYAQGSVKQAAEPGTTPGGSTTPGITATPASGVPVAGVTPAPTGSVTGKPKPKKGDPSGDGQPVRKGSVELKIPTIVMKKVMGPKMKFRIKLLNHQKGKIKFSSSNKKIATIDKTGLVKTKKKTGKCTLVINVSKGKHKIQYIVNLVVRKSCKKNYSLYKYKTTYKYPSVSLYKLVPKGKTYKIKLKHLSKNAKVVYKSNKNAIASVTKKGKVISHKNGRADITVTVEQNGVTYKYFVVVRVTQQGVESNTSYLKVIR